MVAASTDNDARRVREPAPWERPAIAIGGRLGSGRKRHATAARGALARCIMTVAVAAALARAPGAACRQHARISSDAPLPSRRRCFSSCSRRRSTIPAHRSAARWRYS